MGPAVKEMLNRLARSYSVVVNPDHPLLLRGPDALVSDYGNLVAVFTLNSRERQSPSALLVRLGISRYALPQSTRCVLLANNVNNQDLDYFREAFHLVIGEEEGHDLAMVVRDRAAGLGRRQEIPHELRAKYFSQYWAALELSRRAFARAVDSPDWTAATGGEGIHQGQFTRFRFRSWGPRGRDTTSSSLFSPRDGRSLVALLPRRRGAIRGMVEKVIEYRTRGFYEFDRGVMHGHEPNGPSLLVSGAAESTLWDPHKMRRASAFGGWTLVPGLSVPNLPPYEREYDEVTQTISMGRHEDDDTPDVWEGSEDEE